MIPLKDDNPTQNKSYIRLIILLICSFVFFMQITSNDYNFYTYYFGFKPSTFFLNSEIPSFSPTLTLLTSLFMHGGWMHFLGNMLYLWIFADNIEDKMGAKRFIFFYLIAGVFASICHALIDISSDTPLIGASGAIAGVLGAYLYLYPKAKVLVLIPFFIFFTIRIPAFYLLIFWFFYQFINLGSQGSNIAWIAHIGGFIFGLIYSVIFVAKTRPTRIKKGKSILARKKGPWH